MILESCHAMVANNGTNKRTQSVQEAIMSITITSKGTKIADTQIAVGTSANMRTSYKLEDILNVAESLADHGYDASLGPVVVCKLPVPERDSSAMVVVPDKIQKAITNEGGHQVELNGKKHMIVGLAGLASGEEREYGIINGQTRLLAARLLSLLGIDITVPVQVVEYDASLSARIDNDERLLKGHNRIELLARCIVIRSADPTMTQAQLGRALGMTNKDRTRLQWLDAASAYSMKYNDTNLADIDGGAYKAKDLANATGKLDHANRDTGKKEAEPVGVTFQELELMGLTELVAVLKDADKAKRIPYGAKITEALARYK